MKYLIYRYGGYDYRKQLKRVESGYVGLFSWILSCYTGRGYSVYYQRYCIFFLYL